MKWFDNLKKKKWNKNSERSILDEFYYRTDFEPGELATRSGYFRTKERLKEELFRTKEKEAEKEK